MDKLPPGIQEFHIFPWLETRTVFKVLLCQKKHTFFDIGALIKRITLETELQIDPTITKITPRTLRSIREAYIDELYCAFKRSVSTIVSISAFSDRIKDNHKPLFEIYSDVRKIDALRLLAGDGIIISILKNMVFSDSMFYSVIDSLTMHRQTSTFDANEILIYTNSVRKILRIAEPILLNRICRPVYIHDIPGNMYKKFSDICWNLSMREDAIHYSYKGCVSYPQATHEQLDCMYRYMHLQFQLHAGAPLPLNDPKFIQVKNIIDTTFDKYLDVRDYSLRQVSFIATVRYMTGDYENAIFNENVISRDDTEMRLNTNRWRTINMIRLHSLYLLGRHIEVIHEHGKSCVGLIQAMSYLAIGNIALCRTSLISYRRFLESTQYKMGEYELQCVHGSNTFRIMIPFPDEIRTIYNDIESLSALRYYPPQKRYHHKNTRGTRRPNMYTRTENNQRMTFDNKQITQVWGYGPN
jgi:hypothetical protein